MKTWWKPTAQKDIVKMIHEKTQQMSWALTHFPHVPHICVNELDQHCFKQWLVAYSAPSHYLNQLKQLERLHSEDTPRRPMITLTIDQFILNPKSILVTIIDQFISDPKSKQGESRKIWKISEKLKFYNFVINLTRDTPSNGSDYLWHIWK